MTLQLTVSANGRLLAADAIVAARAQDTAPMFITLAYGFVAGTIGLVLMLFWLAWEQHQIRRSNRRD